MITVNVYDWVFDEVELGLALGDWRKARGLIQKDVAAMLGDVTPEYISSVENARNNGGMTLRRFAQFCTLMNYPPDMFFVVERRLL